MGGFFFQFETDACGQSKKDGIITRARTLGLVIYSDLRQAVKRHEQLGKSQNAKRARESGGRFSMDSSWS